MRLREHEGIIPGRNDVLFCKPAEITPEDGYNVRDLTTPEARAELGELKAQIKENGVQTPLKVRFDAANNKIILVEGHRRRTACLELIQEYVDSGGSEGRFIEAVPILQEAAGTHPTDRDFGLETSNSGARLKPLELANLIHRILTVRGVPLETIAKRMGKSLASIKGTLAMRAMPDDVKQHVKAGDVSASLAMKMLKEEPEKVAEMIRTNQEQNKRLGVGAKIKHRVTPKTINRDRPQKAKPSPAPEPIATESPTPPSSSPQEADAAAVPEVGSPAISAPPIAHIDLLQILVELTKQAKHALLSINRPELADAVRVAERVIGLCGNGRDPFATFETAVEETKALAEGEHV